MKHHTLFFSKIWIDVQNLPSAAVVIGALRVNSVSASDNFCHLLTSFANSLDADQA